MGLSPSVALLGLVIAVGVPGCNRKPDWPTPKTYPVAGKVVASRGKIPAGYVIQFEPKDGNVELIARGRINDDGSFALKVLFHERWLPGATEGPHRVKVVPTPESMGQDPVRMIAIEEVYVIEPKENHFTINLDVQ